MMIFTVSKIRQAANKEVDITSASTDLFIGDFSQILWML
jgi:hypothetical protein